MLKNDDATRAVQLSRSALPALVAVFALSAIMAFGAVTAFAGSAYSSNGYYSTNGINYYNYSGIHTDHANNHKAHASTAAISTSGNVSAGWIGALPRRYSSGGSTLLCTGTWTYNSGTASGLAATGCSINNHSIYSSDGQTRAWNGTGYYTYGAFTSPNQNS